MESQSKGNERHVQLDGIKLKQLRLTKFGSRDAMAAAAKVDAQTVANAEKGKLILRASAIMFAEVLGVTLAYLLPDPVEGPFAALIERKTRGFVGRQYIFSAIKEFIDKHDRGYCVIEGEPGAGKTSLLAYWVRQEKCLRFFNDRSQGCNRASHYVDNICRQLDLKFNLSLAPSKISDVQDGSSLSIALLRLRNVFCCQDKIVIAIDAIDEVDLTAQPVGSNVLYLPADVPKSVYFIITRLSGANVPLITNGPLRVISLADYHEETKFDASEYIVQTTDAGKVDSWIRRWRTGKRQFEESLLRKSEGNLLYLQYVLATIESGQHIDLPLERFSEGLDDLYYDQWQNLVVNGSSDNSRGKFLCFLIEMREPVSINCLAYLAAESDENVQDALDVWGCFVRREEISEDRREIKLYSVDHDSLRRFLHDSQVPDLKTVRASIADRLMEAFTKGFAGCTQELQRYCLRHLPSHLAIVRDERVANVLTDVNFLEAKFRSLGLQELIEDYDLVFRLEMFSPLASPPHERHADDASLSLRVLREILFLSEEALGRDETLFRGQLYGRLSPAIAPRLDRLRDQLERSVTPWLCPLESILTNPGFIPNLKRRTPHDEPVAHLVMTADGKHAVSACKSSKDMRLRVWDVSSGDELRTLLGHTSYITSLAATPDGKSVISASDDKTVRVWEVATGKELRVFSHQSEPALALAITPDGNRIVSLQSEALSLMDLLTGQQLHTIPLKSDGGCAKVLVTPDGQQVIFSRSGEPGLQILDLRTNHLYNIAGIYGQGGLAISSNGKWLITATSGLEIFECGTWRLLRRFKDSGTIRSGAMAAITPNCRFVFWSPNKETAEVRDLFEGQPFRFMIDAGEIETCVAGIDNRTFALGTTEGEVYFVRLEVIP